jgi:hypothetical protein
MVVVFVCFGGGMSVYVHLTVIVLDAKVVWAPITVVSYTDTDAYDAEMRCDNHAGNKAMLWRKGSEVRCFHCVPWGNRSLSDGFIRVGKVVIEFK